MRRWTLVWIALLTVGLGALEVEVGEQFPVRGKQVTVEVKSDGTPAAGVKLEALYAPNSKVSSRQSVGTTDENGQLVWTPERAGLVTLTATQGELESQKVVSIRYDRFKPTGILTMVLAGCILFGGIGAGFYLVLASGEPPEALMDT